MSSHTRQTVRLTAAAQPFWLFAQLEDKGRGWRALPRHDGVAPLKNIIIHTNAPIKPIDTHETVL